MPQENQPFTEADHLPTVCRNPAHFGRLLQRLATTVAGEATVSNHSDVVRILLEKINLAGSKADINYALYQKTLTKYEYEKNWAQEVYRKYQLAMNEIDHLHRKIEIKDEQIDQQDQSLLNCRRALKFSQRSWRTANRKYGLREWRCHRLWKTIKDVNQTLAIPFPSTSDDAKEGPSHSAIDGLSSSSDSEDLYQDPPSRSQPARETQSPDDCVLPRKRFKEEEL